VRFSPRAAGEPSVQRIPTMLLAPAMTKPRLPDAVDPDAIQVGLRNGVLELRIPLPEEHRPHRVAIRVYEPPNGGAADSAGDGS
jgi:Hsp20/alpha crystallin family